MHLSHEASLEIKWVDCDILKILSNNRHLALMKDSLTKLHLDAQVLEERDQAKALSEKNVILYLRKQYVTIHLTAYCCVRF